MARAILDIPSMPQNCYECPMRRMYRRKWFCQIIMHVALKEKRRPDCPLIEMDVKLLLKQARSAIKAACGGTSENLAIRIADETVEAIDKALERMEDA